MDDFKESFVELVSYFKCNECNLEIEHCSRCGDNFERDNEEIWCYNEGIDPQHLCKKCAIETNVKIENK